ncbi:hypothetical protein M405DRAFT_296659 [Rhizopogon salebrosus TDB-379]|nr:hypothetical protein M405DRAFT_296659 [Rhizopogon salebrosus TDB-379]
MDPNNVALKDLTIFCGKGKHIVSFPVSQGTMINVVAHVSDRQKASTSFDDHWVSDVPREEVEKAYQDFEPAAKNLLKLFERPSRWALHVVNELPLFTSERVALIGDACHAMTPYMAAGAGMAIEDAFVLGRLLAHPLTSLGSLPAALKAYQDVRLSVTQLVARESYRAGCLLQFSMHGHYDGTDRGNEREGLEILKELITRQHDNDGKGGVIAEWLEAEKKLRESAGLCNDCC